MKTKIIKNPGWWKLVVQDKAINEAYDCSNERPIVLGVITNFFGSGCWGVQDYRAKKHLLPSAYLEEGVEEFFPKNDIEKDVILAEVPDAEVDEKGVIYWNRFNSYLYDGDNPEHKDKYGNVYNVVARFSFKEALKRLQEQKAFWEGYEKDDLKLDEVRIDNPYRRKSGTEFSFMFYEQKLKKNKP